MTDGQCPFAQQIVGVTTFSPGYSDRVGFADHTAGGFLSTMKAASFWNNAGVSTHFAIGRDGSVIQMVNIFDTAFAQGRLGPVVTWKPYDEMKAQTGTGNPNAWLISTEHEDAETVGGQTRFVQGSMWTAAQYDADLRVKRWCVDEVQRVTGKNLLRFGVDSLAGHHMFDGVNRAECPGRYWRIEYRDRLYRDLTGGAQMPAENYVGEANERRARELLNWYMYNGKVKVAHAANGLTITGPDGVPLSLAIDIPSWAKAT